MKTSSAWSQKSSADSHSVALSEIVSFLEDFHRQPPEVFFKKAVLKNFAILTGKHLCWSLF